MTPREPDRFDKQAAEIFASGDWRFHDRVAAALRAVEADALERAAQIVRTRRALSCAACTSIADAIEALASPAAAPAAESRVDGCWHGEKGHPCALPQVEELEALLAEVEEALSHLGTAPGSPTDRIKRKLAARKEAK